MGGRVRPGWVVDKWVVQMRKYEMLPKQEPDLLAIIMVASAQIMIFVLF